MAGAEKKRLTSFEVETKPTKKKSGSTAPKKGAKGASAASSAQKTGTKPKNSTSKQGMKTTNTARKTPAKSKNKIEENPISRRSSQARAAQPKPRAAARPDAYDRPAARTAKAVPAKKRKKKKQSGFSAVSAMLLALIFCLAGLGAWRVVEYREFREMKAAVSRQTFYEGTTVDGIDVSGMTLQQAIEYWNTQIEPAYRDAVITLSDGTQVSALQLGYSSNHADVLSGAWNVGRSGSLEERYHRMTQSAGQPQSHLTARTLYDADLLQQYVQGIAAQVDRNPVNASLKGFDLENYTFEFEDDQVGYTLNQEALSRDIIRMLSSGGGKVELQIETVQPQFTKENVSSQYGMISYAVTNASSSSSNRLSNIRQALASINGICLEPGQTFSFNEVVGQRTKDRGYKVATAYSSGKVTEEVGGGICQVSTTLFNAAVKADLKIKERSAHSLTVSYVDIGKDAAVDWGNKDLKFTNTSEDKVYICGYVTGDKRVRIGVFGRLLEDGVTITVEGKKTGTREFNTEYQMNFNLGNGQTKVIQKGKDGYSATTYKIWWDAQGNEIRREELCKSNYQATPEIVEYGVM